MGTTATIEAQSVKEFPMKLGHVVTMNHMINRLQETDSMGRITKGLNKTDAQMVTSLIDALDLEELDANNRKLTEDYGVHSLSGMQLQWVKNQINEVFEKSLMPIWASRWAFDVLEWTVA